MDKVLLVTRPKYDDGTEYLSVYALEVIKEAERSHILFKDFEGKNVNKQEIEKYLKMKNPKLIFLNGHGNEDEICGHKDEMLFSKENAHLLKNKVTYARACFAGISLGKEIVRDNDGCFIGYTTPFSFWISDVWSTKPLNDKIASLYLKPSNEIVLRLIKGETSKSANEISKKMMIENMKKILALEQKKEPGATTMLQILWGNYEGQVVLGNENFTL
jgi:hypothetical protein